MTAGLRVGSLWEPLATVKSWDPACSSVVRTYWEGREWRRQVERRLWSFPWRGGGVEREVGGRKPLIQGEREADGAREGRQELVPESKTRAGEADARVEAEQDVSTWGLEDKRSHLMVLVFFTEGEGGPWLGGQKGMWEV